MKKIPVSGRKYSRSVVRSATSPPSTTTPGPAGTLTVGKLVKAGPFKAKRVGKVTITTSAKTMFVGTLKLGKKLVKKITVSGGPGKVTISLVAPRAGTYTLTVTAGTQTRTLPIVVTR